MPTAAVAPSKSSGDASVCEPTASPKTAAGRRLEELVVATSAPDRAAAESFVATAMTDEVRARHGGFVLDNAGDDLVLTLCRVAYSGSDQVVAIVGGANGAARVQYAALVLAVDGDDKVASFGVMPASREDLEAPLKALDDAGLRRVVDAVADSLSGYVFYERRSSSRRSSPVRRSLSVRSTRWSVTSRS